VRDKNWGVLLFVLSVLGMVGYFCWLFLTPRDWKILGISLWEWALIIPIMILVFAFLFVVAWIGKTMATTPPPLSVSEQNAEKKRKGTAVGLPSLF